MAIKTFTAGSVLTAADTNTYLANSGLVYVGGSDFSNELIVYANNVFSSAYDFYTVECTFVGSTATEIGLRWQTGTNTPDTTSNYYRYGFYNLTGIFQLNASATNYSFFGNSNSTAGVTSWTRLAVFNPNRSDTRTMWQHQHFDAQSGLQAYSDQQHATNTSFTGFRVYATNGTSTLTGRIRIYGMRQA